MAPALLASLLTLAPAAAQPTGNAEAVRAVKRREAIEALEHILATHTLTDDERAERHVRMADLHTRSGNPVASQAALRRVLVEHPGTVFAGPAAASLVTQVTALQGVEAAHQELQSLLDSPQTRHLGITATLQLAEQLFEQGRFADALPLYQSLPEDAAIHYYGRYRTAWCLLKTGRHTEAVVAMESLLRWASDTSATTQAEERAAMKPVAAGELAIFRQLAP